MNWKRRLVLILAAILLLGVLLLAISFFFSDFLVDYWWYSSMGYGEYYWNRLLYRYIVFIAATLVFFLIFFLNFWVASRFLGTTVPREASTDAEVRRSYRKLFRRFREGSIKVYLPLSLVLGILIAIPLYRYWEATLLYVFAPDTGVEDNVYGNDISYYLFSLRIYVLIIRELFVAFIVLLFALAILYWLEARILSKHDHRLPRGAKIHLNVLLALLFFITVWDFVLQRHLLLYSENHMPLFYGPGYVEMNVILPLLWTCIVLLLGIGVSLIRLINTRRGWLSLMLFGVLFGAALFLRYSPFLPNTIQEYFVKPNAISMEAPYIANNIEATLGAYDLLDVENREYPIKDPPWNMTTPEIQASLRNIPVWDENEFLLQVYKQLQEIRTYYEFPSVDVDRYNVNGVYQQVFLSPREINTRELPEGARNWINEWLKYTHGYGAVMTPAAQTTGPGPITFFLQGIPPESEYGIQIGEPAIYYGLETYNPVIAPNDSRELDYPLETDLVLTDYQGRGGVEINNLWRKLIFSLYFKERNIFFTTNTNDKSRILFRRNIIERIKTLAPFLQLDRDPYIVVTSDQMYWIQDAYTSSDWYPYARPYGDRDVVAPLPPNREGVPVSEQTTSTQTLGAQKPQLGGSQWLPSYEKNLNYIRNSVKIVVDAFHGTVNFYIADPKDPIVQAYARIYPELFKNLDQLPEALKPHLRYPKDIFDTQMSIYAKYHQKNPELFYKQEDMWVFPQVQWRDDIIAITSYYLTLNLFNRDKFEFILLTPMNPKGRDNLRSLAAVGSDQDNYGKIVIYNFPKGVLVYGPPQVDALIKQDPEIASQFTLWNQSGSRVDRGRMVIVPVDGVIVYIQAVYLKATVRSQIPELTRVIVSQGDLVTMEPTLAESFMALNEAIRADLSQAPAQQQLETPKQPPEVIPETPPAAARETQPPAVREQDEAEELVRKQPGVQNLNLLPPTVPEAQQAESEASKATPPIVTEAPKAAGAAPPPSAPEDRQDEAEALATPPAPEERPTPREAVATPPAETAKDAQTVSEAPPPAPVKRWEDLRRDLEKLRTKPLDASQPEETTSSGEIRTLPLDILKESQGENLQ